MSLPVNKKTLDTTIDTNIKANNPPNQSITAEVLHDTLIPIVNSTFGLKTIWCGILRTFDNYTSTANKHSFKVVEDYYDPNYFPSLSPTTLTSAGGVADYQQVGCRYKLLTVGSTITPGTYLNCGTTITTAGTTQTEDLTRSGTVWRPASGLTFDILVGSGGTVTGIVVNNSGSGYSWCGNAQGVTITPQVITINSGISSATPITIEIDLSRVISGAFSNTYNGEISLPYNFSASALALVHNFYIDNASSLGVNAPGICISENDSPLANPDNTGTPYSLNLQHEAGANQYKTYLKSLIGVNRTVNGYYGVVPYFNFSAGDIKAIYNKYVELKVPIINTTI
jgi:hypothetical protein